MYFQLIKLAQQSVVTITNPSVESFMALDRNKKIYLFANCIPVAGAKNYIICDLHRGSIFKIDAIFYQIAVEHKEKSIQEIISFYGDEYASEIEGYIEKIIGLELAVLVDDKTNFLPLSMEWDSPSVIENMIVEYGTEFKDNLTEIMEQMNALLVRFIEIRFYRKVSFEEIESLLVSLKATKIRGIYLIIQGIEAERAEKLIMVHQRISHLMVYNVEKSEIKNYALHDRLSAVEQSISDNQCCGVVEESFFNPNIKMFTESQQFNSCLNRKLTIMENGDIKNCPSLMDVCGNIKVDSLIKAAHSSELQKYWGINKNQISVCKDCEYRFVCTDCRAFVSDPADILSKPLKCGYDPYAGEWEEWSKNPLKEKAKAHYSL